MTVKAESKASCCQTCNPQLGYLASSTVAWAKSYQFFHQSTFLFSFPFQRHGPHEIIKRPPFISLCPQCSLSLSLTIHLLLLPFTWKTGIKLPLFSWAHLLDFVTIKFYAQTGQFCMGGVTATSFNTINFCNIQKQQ